MRRAVQKGAFEKHKSNCDSCRRLGGRRRIRAFKTAVLQAECTETSLSVTDTAGLDACPYKVDS